jgi:hypothetical protein
MGKELGREMVEADESGELVKVWELDIMDHQLGQEGVIGYQREMKWESGAQIWFRTLLIVLILLAIARGTGPSIVS